MVRNVSDEELQLKKRARRRLVGAIVLVTAVAVVLPMILDSEPKQVSQDINIRIPSPEAGVLSAKPVPLKRAEETAAVSVPTPPTQQIKAAPQSEAKPETKSQTKPEPKAEAKPAPKQPAKAKAKDNGTDKAAPGGFVIQVIALADAAKAKEMLQKISGSGLKAYTEVVQAANGPVTRVRVGPYPSRDAAEQARKKLQGMELDGKVIPR